MKAHPRRKDFPVTEEYVFFNHAGCSPASRPVVDAICEQEKARMLHGTRDFFTWVKRIENTRGAAADLIGAAPEEIAFVENTSQGLSYVAAGLPWQPDDVVVVSRPDYPSLLYPWEHLKERGVQVRYIERTKGALDLDDVARKLQGARLLVVSTVDWLTGWAADLPALSKICRDAGALFCVDAIQSLGAMPLNVREAGIDFLAAGGHKWLMGPLGAGMLYISQKVNHLMRPPVVGWKSAKDPEEFSLDFALREDASRFEPGTMNLSGIFALSAAFEMIRDVGVGEIQERIFQANDLLAAGLRERGYAIVSPTEGARRSGILCFTPKGAPEALFKHLMHNKVFVALRGGNIRLAPHFYNDAGDVERFFTVLDQSD